MDNRLIKDRYGYANHLPRKGIAGKAKVRAWNDRLNHQNNISWETDPLSTGPSTRARES